MSREEIFFRFTKQAGWKSASRVAKNLKNLSEHALLLGTSEYTLYNKCTWIFLLKPSDFLTVSNQKEFWSKLWGCLQNTDRKTWKINYIHSVSTYLGDFKLFQSEFWRRCRNSSRILQGFRILSRITRWLQLFLQLTLRIYWLIDWCNGTLIIQDQPSRLIR